MILNLFCNRKIMSVKKLFEGGVSNLFAKARPVVSVEAKEKVINYLSEKISPPFEFAIDVGCGTGHSTCLFVPHFKKLLGIDVSSTQIEQAKKNYPFPNVSYAVGKATALPVENESTTLIVCAQTAHWLNMPKFYAECNRVLIPNGVLAILGYGLFHVNYKNNAEINKKLNDAIKKFYDVLADGGFWDEHRYIVDRQYVEFELPYKDQRIIRNDTSIYLHREMQISTVAEYLSTWSGYGEYLKQNPNNNLLAELKTTFVRSVPGGSEDTVLDAVFPWFILMCRKP